MFWALTKMSFEHPNKVRKVDHNGFRMRQVYVDARNLSAYQKLGGDKNAENLSDLPLNKTIREEEDDAQYILEGPLRRLKPYYFTYMTHCKQRWMDQNILKVFSHEFRLHPESYYRNALEKGRVTVNEKVANPDTILRNGDLIAHRMHRHEPPVTSRPIKIVYQDDELLVIDKPSGLPVHPTGRYRHNTVTFILEKEHGIKAHPCNRLDRLTSGLMFLGKTAAGAEKMVKQMREREVSKQYIAKVVGEFPPGVDIVCEEPLRTVDPRIAFNIVDRENGKEAKTSFKRLSFDGETSLVLCKPFTGRTHQIRVHLQFLGYPIVNDPLYSSPKIWGDNLGKNGDFDIIEKSEKLSKIGKTEPATSWLHQNDNGEIQSTGNFCDDCGGQLYSDPGPNDLDLYLHAYKYSSSLDDGWSYQTELPDWALESQKKYMSLALEQAEKCPPLDTAFCVGAVITCGGKVLATGHTRELEGNTHAEQCALEKYFKQTGSRTLPEGSEIYTTMEPCSERLSGNEPCADRILKLADKITTCFVGVLEPDDFVANNVSRRKLETAGISYIQVPGFEEKSLAVAKKGHEVS
ncbi:hypothetical protein OGAPHI_004480 [Ogataea philodendri]|uniref:tRNA pseudouridine(32) synthase n=1 Tax=Ogataea philodendri TaxID=1378263 RepID=A0A9P8T5U4_9ASCO|nr:uncharacterized protein OGAPHI_004480 [Ogataea philodendri]KAH3666291.1 hypothetical protein OGAPHI_004480 [Ogataea philodendri]